MYTKRSLSTHWLTVLRILRTLAHTHTPREVRTHVLTSGTSTQRIILLLGQCERVYVCVVSFPTRRDKPTQTSAARDDNYNDAAAIIRTSGQPSAAQCCGRALSDVECANCPPHATPDKLIAFGRCCDVWSTHQREICTAVRRLGSFKAGTHTHTQTHANVTRATCATTDDESVSQSVGSVVFARSGSSCRRRRPIQSISLPVCVRDRDYICVYWRQYVRDVSSSHTLSFSLSLSISLAPSILPSLFPPLWQSIVICSCDTW